MIFLLFWKQKSKNKNTFNAKKYKTKEFHEIPKANIHKRINKGQINEVFVRNLEIKKNI